MSDSCLLLVASPPSQLDLHHTLVKLCAFNMQLKFTAFILEESHNRAGGSILYTSQIHGHREEIKAISGTFLFSSFSCCPLILDDLCIYSEEPPRSKDPPDPVKEFIFSIPKIILEAAQYGPSFDLYDQIVAMCLLSFDT